MNTSGILNYTFSYNVIAVIAAETEGEFYPVVRVECNGQFIEQRQFIIGLSENAAKSFAREFAREIIEEYQQSLNRIMADLQQRNGKL